MTSVRDFFELSPSLSQTRAHTFLSPAQAPNTARKKQVGPLLSPRHVGGDDHARLLPPNCALPAGLPEDVALVVAVVIYENSQESYEKYQESERVANVGAVLGQVEAVTSVHTGRIKDGQCPLYVVYVTIFGFFFFRSPLFSSLL